MNSPSNRIWALVPAAGVGTRMQTEIPKQYLKIRGRSVIEITLSKLASIKELQSVVVAIGEGDAHFSNIARLFPSVVTVTGGESRAQSVLNGLEAIINSGGVADWVLVHDAARPCVKEENIRALMDYCISSNQGAILAVPAADTLKLASPDKKIKQTLDRSVIWQAHTPQMFRVQHLFDALTICFKKQYSVTDEASAMEFIGDTVGLVDDSRDNLKITRPEDLAIAEFILSKQK